MRKGFFFCLKIILKKFAKRGFTSCPISVIVSIESKTREETKKMNKNINEDLMETVEDFNESETAAVIFYMKEVGIYDTYEYASDSDLFEAEEMLAEQGHYVVFSKTTESNIQITEKEIEEIVIKIA